ncbi:MAG TPA: hypothetical protein VGK29_13075 [Paludibaculum sp.]
MDKWNNDKLTRQAMLCAGIAMAHQVASKATRDALFLGAFASSDLPRIVIAGAAASLALGWVFSRLLSAFGPRRVVPAGFVLSALVQALAWKLQPEFPKLVAAGMYLHLVAFGAVLLSGFWSMSSELFDARTAKLRFGRIAGAGTAGGIMGGIMAERVAAWLPQEYSLLMLAMLHLAAAVGLVMLRRAPGGVRPAEPEAVPAREVFRQAPYLRYLAGLVLLGTASAAVLDYLFKVGATETFGRGANLLRFFAIFYTCAQILTFLAQTFLTRPALEKLGLSRTVATLPVAVGLGGMAALSFPVFGAYALARGLEQILRGSLFRSGYELFYNPVPPAEKRSAKTLIDVGCDRMGDALGAGVVQLFLMLGPSMVRSEALGVTIGFAIAALWLAMRLDKAYSRILERSLVSRAEELDLLSTADAGGRTAATQTITMARPRELRQESPAPLPVIPAGGDEVLESLRALRSGDVGRVRAELHRLPPMDGVQAAQVIRLLAWDLVSSDARRVLLEARDRLVGVMVDHLTDPDEDFAVRRRLPRILSHCDNPRAVLGLLLGLQDARFEVRFNCGRSLDAVKQRNPETAIPEEAVHAILERELSASRSIWESYRLLDRREAGEEYEFLDENLRERANQSMEHIFSLLALVLPREPLKIAFQALHTDDRMLRGLAREYMDTLLPEEVKVKFWTLVEAIPTAGASTPAETLERLVQSSYTLLRRPAGAG